MRTKGPISFNTNFLMGLFDELINDTSPAWRINFSFPTNDLDCKTAWPKPFGSFCVIQKITEFSNLLLNDFVSFEFLDPTVKWFSIVLLYFPVTKQNSLIP